jgi:hypothetical protein
MTRRRSGSRIDLRSDTSGVLRWVPPWDVWTCRTRRTSTASTQSATVFLTVTWSRVLMRSGRFTDRIIPTLPRLRRLCQRQPGEPDDWTCVVPYPPGIYAIDAPDDWRKPEDERRPCGEESLNLLDPRRHQIRRPAWLLEHSAKKSIGSRDRANPDRALAPDSVKERAQSRSSTGTDALQISDQMCYCRRGCRCPGEVDLRRRVLESNGGGL